jgi:hypothetical protein
MMGNLAMVDGIPTLMSYTLFPDVTISTPSVTNEASGTPGLMMTLVISVEKAMKK